MVAQYNVRMIVRDEKVSKRKCFNAREHFYLADVRPMRCRIYISTCMFNELYLFSNIPDIELN